jgi:RES domain-containing protein
VQLFRIAKTRFIKDLTGAGGEMYGGRWNRKVTAVIYTSENRSLATVEYLVHVPLSLVPTDLSIACLEIPDPIIPKEILLSELPRNWRNYPAPQQLAELGPKWVLGNSSLLLRVASAVVENEYNVLINPIHPDMSTVSISNVERYAFDKRLVRRKKVK